MEILADAVPDKAAIPRSTDGMVDIQSLLRLLAEQVVNAIMDEEADQLCGDGPTAGTATGTAASRRAWARST